REGRSPLAKKSSPTACTSGAGADFCVGKSYFPEQKSLPCSFRARKSEGFQRKLVGVVVAGERAPPSTSLSKNYLTSKKARGLEPGVSRGARQLLLIAAAFRP